MAHDVFISYSSADKLTADAICAVLEQHDVRVWIAPRDVLAGSDWAASIVEAIENCRVMVLVFSSHANKSPQICREVERAVSKGIVILPLRIENTLPSKSLEYFISARHWLDAMTPPLDAHLTRLAKTIKHLMTDTEELRKRREAHERLEPDDQLWVDKVARVVSRRRRVPWPAIAVATVVVCGLLFWQEKVRSAIETVISGGSAEQAEVHDTKAEAAEHIERTAKLLDTAEFHAAKDEADRAIALDPESALAYAYRAIAQAMYSEADASEADSNHALKLAPELSEGYAARAMTWAEKNDLRLAARDADDAVRCDPKNVWARLARGYVHMQMFEYPQALENFESVIDTPTRAVALTYRGFVRFKMGDYQKAIEATTQALELTPRNTLALDLRSISYSRMGKAKESLADADEAVRLDSVNPFTYSVRAAAFLLNDKPFDALADAQESLRRAGAMKLNPQMESDVCATAGWACASTQRWDEALKYAEEAVAKNPRYDYAYMVRGLVKLKWLSEEPSRDPAGAEADLARAAGLSPKNVYNWYWLAIALLHREEAEKYEQALQAIDQVILLGAGGDMTANLVKLQCLVKLERYADAVETAKLAKEEIHRQEGAEALCCFWSGRAYMGLGKYPEAEAEFAEAVQLSPKEAYDWYWLGTAQMGQNTPEKFEAAIKSYDRSLEMGKHDDAAPSVFKLTCLGALGKWKEVIDGAPAAREQQDNETGGAALVHFWVGRAHIALSQPKEAESELSESCKLNPTDQYALYWLGVARMKLEKYSEAVEPLTKSVKLGYLEPDLFASLERALTLSGKPADAIAVSDDAIKRLKVAQKELGTVYYWRGSAHMAQQKWDEADSDFTKALANESEANYKLYSRGSVRIMKGEFKAALADLQKIENPEEMTDRDPDVYTLLARCHVELEQWPEAHASAERATAFCTKLKRSLEKPIFWRGRADFGAAELTKAEADFAEAVKLGPKAARNHYWLARVYAAQGKHTEAVAAFKEAKAGELAADLKDLDELLKQSEEKVASADAKP